MAFIMNGVCLTYKSGNKKTFTVCKYYDIRKMNIFVYHYEKKSLIAFFSGKAQKKKK